MYEGTISVISYMMVYRSCD